MARLKQNVEKYFCRENVDEIPVRGFCGSCEFDVDDNEN
jgi:hypothetical protein